MNAPSQPKRSPFRKLANSVLKRYCNFVNKHTDFYVAAKPDFHTDLDRVQNFERLYENWIRQNAKNDRSDLPRFYFLHLQIEALQARGVAGAFAELGVFRGTTAKLFRTLAPERELYLFDTFEGFTAEDAELDFRKVRAGGWACSLDRVKAFVGEGNIRYLQGRFPETAALVPPHVQFALVHLDADLYQPQVEGLRFFYPRTVRGGVIVIHDCNNRFTGSRKALDEFFVGKPELPVFIPDKSGSAVVIKSV